MIRSYLLMRKWQPKPITVNSFLLRMDAKRTGSVERREVYTAVPT